MYVPVCVSTCTVFPRNLAAVRVYFKAFFDVATIRGWLDFEGSVYRDQHACACTASVMSLIVCTYMSNVYAHTYTVGDPIPCREISRAVFIGMRWLKYVARFRGRRDFKVWQDFKEIQYM